MVKRTTPANSEPLFNIHEYNCNPPTREIYLHSYYNSESNDEIGVDFRMATTFAKNLNLLNHQNSTNILVHMHTVGGDWNDGIAIYNNVLFSIAPITILAHAHARSMSSIILQAADTRVLMPDADFMIHHGYIGEEGVTTAVESSIAHNKRLTKRMLAIYALKCIDGEYFKKHKSMTPAKVMTFLNRQIEKYVDWWMTAEEAVDYGFADGILGRDYNWEEIRG